MLWQKLFGRKLKLESTSGTDHIIDRSFSILNKLSDLTDVWEAERKSAIDDALGMITDAYPDWRKDIRTLKFNEWQKSLPPHILERLERSQNPQYVIKMLGQYNEWLQQSAQIKTAAAKEPLFELRNNDGRTWKLYEDGTAIGFPVGTLVINRAFVELNALRAQIKRS